MLAALPHVGTDVEIRTEDHGQGLSGLEELRGRDGIAVGGVDGDVGEGALEELEDGPAGGDSGRGGHCERLRRGSVTGDRSVGG